MVGTDGCAEAVAFEEGGGMVCFSGAGVERVAVVGVAAAEVEARACETAPDICCVMVRLRLVKPVDGS